MFQVAKQFFLDFSFFLAEVDEKCRYQNIGRNDLVSNLVNAGLFCYIPVLFKLLLLRIHRSKSAFATKTNKFNSYSYTRESQVCHFIIFFNLSLNLFSERRLEKIACVAGGIVVPGVTFLAAEPLREAIAVKPRGIFASGAAAQNLTALAC